jgi:hypothetical protein
VRSSGVTPSFIADSAEASPMAMHIDAEAARVPTP